MISHYRWSRKRGHPTNYGQNGQSGDRWGKEILAATLKLGRDAGNYVPGFIIPALVSIVAVSVFTRVFNPDEYGQYALVMATTSIITLLLSGWISQSILRFLPEYNASDHLTDFTKSTVTIIFGAAGFFALLSLFAYPFLAHILGEYKRFYLLTCLLVVTGSIFSTCNSIFQGKLQSPKFAKYKIFLSIGQISFSLVFVFLIAKDVIALITGYLISYIVILPFMVKEIGLCRQCIRCNLVLDISLVRKFLSFGIPMLGWIMGSYILNISDRFIIQVFRGASEVGIYSANYSLASTGISLVSAPFLMAAHPLIMNAWESGKNERISNIISAFSRYFLLIGVPIAFYFAVFGREIVSIFLGKEFQSGYVVVPIILLGLLAWNFSMYGHKGLEIMKKTQIMFLLVGICAVVNLGLNVIFVPVYGYIAAAISTLVSYSLYPFMVYFLAKPYIQWRIPWQSVARIATSSLMTAGFLSFFKFWIFGASLNIGLLVVLSLCGLIIYIGLLYLFRELWDYEINYLRKKLTMLFLRHGESDQ